MTTATSTKRPTPAATKPNAALVPLHNRSLIEKFAERYTIDADKLMGILKATAFKVSQGEVSNEQMAALLVVADQYGLNPFTREIFAFEDKYKGIVPVVSIDGWARIINEHDQFNGLEFTYPEVEVAAREGGRSAFEWVECVIYRKDRDHPIKLREHLDETYQPPRGQNKTHGPWQSHPKRMLRHKALIQCARIAFGFAGIYDEDEAHRIIDSGDPTAAQPRGGAAGLRHALVGPRAEPAVIDAEGATSTAEHKPKPTGTNEERDRIVAKLKACTDVEVLALARDEANLLEWTGPDQQVIDEAYRARKDALEAG